MGAGQSHIYVKLFYYRVVRLKKRLNGNRIDLYQLFSLICITLSHWHETADIFHPIFLYDCATGGPCAAVLAP